MSYGAILLIDLAYTQKYLHHQIEPKIKKNKLPLLPLSVKNDNKIP